MMLLKMDGAPDQRGDVRAVRDLSIGDGTWSTESIADTSFINGSLSEKT